MKSITKLSGELQSESLQRKHQTLSSTTKENLQLETFKYHSETQKSRAHWRMFWLNTMIYSNIVIKSNLFVIIFHGSTPRLDAVSPSTALSVAHLFFVVFCCFGGFMLLFFRPCYHVTFSDHKKKVSRLMQFYVMTFRCTNLITLTRDKSNFSAKVVKYSWMKSGEINSRSRSATEKCLRMSRRLRMMINADTGVIWMRRFFAVSTPLSHQIYIFNWNLTLNCKRLQAGESQNALEAERDIIKQIRLGEFAWWQIAGTLENSLWVAENNAWISCISSNSFVSSKMRTQKSTLNVQCIQIR